SHHRIDLGERRCRGRRPVARRRARLCPRCRPQAELWRIEQITPTRPILRIRRSLIGPAYDEPVIYVGVDNPPGALGSYEPVQRVCRTVVYNVRAEAGGRRDVSVTRCFVGPEPGPVIEK